MWYAFALLLLVATCGAIEPRCGTTQQNNTIPLHTAAPVFVKAVPNGKLYMAGAGNDTFRIVHVYGTPYEMGKANGQLMGNAAFVQLETLFYAYLDSVVAGEVPDVPTWIVKFLVNNGIPALLDLTIDWTKPFTPQRFVDEMTGLADGAGVDLARVWRINMFPELIKASCTVVGATDQSTPNGKLAQLRALDFPVGNPIKDWAQVTVYHVSNAKPFANIGWGVLIGSLTGFSASGIGIGEKVWLHQKAETIGVRGKPWMFILRDALMAPSVDVAISQMHEANRTCAIHVGIGGETENKFRGITMAKNAFDVYNDTTLNYPEHPILKGVVYWDKHSQPTHDYCLSDLLTQYYGQLDAETLALQVASLSETGSFHSVAFDYKGRVAYIANSRKTFETVGNINAYARQYTKIDLTALFNEQQ